MKPHARLAAMLGVAAFLACPQAIHYCDPDNCTGCCYQGQCQPGDQLQACGVLGAACQVCAAGYTCSGGGCSPMTSSDGGADSGMVGIDASSLDSGSFDSSGPFDSGTPPDAAAADSGLTDSGAPDAQSVDAGASDSGSIVPDGGSAVALTVSAGGVFTCALNASSVLRCWGTNTNGELGNNSMNDSSTPVSVQQLAGPVAAVSAGDWHACALLTSGGVQCWGSNTSGEIGDGFTSDDWVATGVVGFASGAASVSAGSVHTCALTTSGGAVCWGSNLFGQLGDGTGQDQHTPVSVLGLSSGVLAVSACGHNACALVTGGGVKCWGDDTYGQCGDNQTGMDTTPVNVTGLAAGASAVVVGGDTACAIVSGGVKCWGDNEHGQAGNGTVTATQPTPVAVQNLGGPVTALAVGGSHACVIISGGSVQCWGWNKFGQLGDGTNTDHSSPTNVVGLAGTATEISAGSGHSCARLNTGTVMCWGQNAYLQLGAAVDGGSNVPVAVTGL